jgi:hypothetical protein
MVDNLLMVGRKLKKKKQMHLSKEKVKQLQITKFKRLMNNLCLKT